MKAHACSFRLFSLLFLGEKRKHLRSAINCLMVVLLSIAMLYWVLPANAVVLCHDYTLYRVTCANKKCEDPNRTSSTDLYNRLTELGYKAFPISTAAENPEYAGRFLKPGDVLILGKNWAHSGFVNANGTIDHFIQVPPDFQKGEKWGKEHALNNLPKPTQGRLGGFLKGDTLADFLGRISNKEIIKSVVVWRRPNGCSDLTGSWRNTIPEGSSTWTINRNGSGGYQAAESGMGNARSKSVTISGNTLRIVWITGGIEGYYEWKLDANCQQSTKGTLVWTRGLSGSRNSTLKRQ